MKSCKWAEAVDKVVFKFMYGVSILAAIALILTAVLCTVDSLSAKILSYSIPNGTDWVTYLNIPIVFLAMGFIQVERGNTVVDLVCSKFPKGMQKVVQVFGYLLGTFISGYLAVCEFDLTGQKLATGAKASAAGNSFVVWPFALIIAIGYLLVAIAFIWCIFRVFLIPPEKRQGALIPGIAEGNPGAVIGEAAPVGEYKKPETNKTKDKNGDGNRSNDKEKGGMGS